MAPRVSAELETVRHPFGAQAPGGAQDITGQRRCCICKKLNKGIEGGRDAVKGGCELGCHMVAVGAVGESVWGWCGAVIAGGFWVVGFPPFPARTGRAC